MSRVNKIKLVQGVGINDAGYDVYERETINGKRKFTWRCPFYQRWQNMLERCYSSAFHKNNHTYIGCSVCVDWLLFSNFKKWMETQDWKGKQLDKDILFPGNKIYSPETCVFVSGQLNTFLIDKPSRGEYAIGVTWDNDKEKLKASCKNPFTKRYEHLGYFSKREEKSAHLAWVKRKNEFAIRYANEQTDHRISKVLMERFGGEYKCPD